MPITTVIRDGAAEAKGLFWRVLEDEFQYLRRSGSFHKGFGQNLDPKVIVV